MVLYVLILAKDRLVVVGPCRFATLLYMAFVDKGLRGPKLWVELKSVAWPSFLFLVRSSFGLLSLLLLLLQLEGSDDDAAGAERRAKREKISCDVEKVDFTLCRSCDKCDDVYRLVDCIG